MVTVKKISKTSKGKKYQGGGSIDPTTFFKERAAKDTTKPYNREEAIYNMNRIIRGELKPVASKPRSTAKGVTKYADVKDGDTTYMTKGEFERKHSDLIKKQKSGGKLLKRADGSKSPRGLWDNIRAAKGSGKKPTAAMLKQEKKIKAKTKK